MILLGRVSNPNGVNLHSNGATTANGAISFKPQRGKFTHLAGQRLSHLSLVSNPNGVNLHSRVWILTTASSVSNPNGVNLHSTKILIFKAVCDKSLYFQALKQLKFNRSKNLKREYIAIYKTYKTLYRRSGQRYTIKNKQTWAAKVKIVIINMK